MTTSRESKSSITIPRPARILLSQKNLNIKSRRYTALLNLNGVG
jgi:hypothetical protein